jgi:hypothetical protein
MSPIILKAFSIYASLCFRIAFVGYCQVVRNRTIVVMKYQIPGNWYHFKIVKKYFNPWWKSSIDSIAFVSFPSFASLNRSLLSSVDDLRSLYPRVDKDRMRISADDSRSIMLFTSVMF